jgi:hypothetical protein
MSLIKRPPQPAETVQLSVKLSAEVSKKLDAYVKYLGGGATKGYVVEEALKRVFSKDREFARNGSGQHGDDHGGEHAE